MQEVHVAVTLPTERFFSLFILLLKLNRVRHEAEMRQENTQSVSTMYFLEIRRTKCESTQN